ncbi:MAG: hypothetical protein NTX44_05080 [Ignavibacteriales bacterium]|nr:hypothetical protein [Ignavibacteriales bacterium]
MKIVKEAIVMVFIIVSFACKDNATNPSINQPTRALSLRANATSGTSPCNIILTGTFNAYTDTTTMHTPDMFVIGGPGLTVIPYWLSGYPPIPAKRTYIDTLYFPYAGSFSVHMLLQTMTQDIYSDTITFTIN